MISSSSAVIVKSQNKETYSSLDVKLGTEW